MAQLKQEIKKVIGKDGKIVPFEIGKIKEDIFKAAKSVGGSDENLALELANKVTTEVFEQFTSTIPTSEAIYDTTERILIEEGHATTAKAYILLRHKREQERSRRALILGSGQQEDSLLFSDHALTILKRRYLLRNKEGRTVETPKQMLTRVAHNVALADKNYKSSKEEIALIEKRFYDMMAELRFLPNSPTLMNAATKRQQLSSCFVLPIEDTMKGIFMTLYHAATIHQRGSGTGFSFSRLRPKGSSVGMHQGVASGPVDFMKVYDKALDVVKQGGVRPGANMAVLRVDHPDILRFIEAKRDRRILQNFNQSVAITDRFMRAVVEDRQYFLTNPNSGKNVGKLRARDVFSIIVQNAWKTGDPGLIFIDEINRRHPAKHLGLIETTNQCGEAPMLPYEGCVLGSLNLNKFVDVKEKKVLWDLLEETIRTAVHFLDNVIDMNSYPTESIEKMTKKTRKFGLGFMGFADMLVKLKIKYDSQEGLQFAERLMAFMKNAIYESSERLAKIRGTFPAWAGSEHERYGRKMRNASCMSISPTGTISILAGASSGCEPFFAISYHKTILGNTELVHVNKEFERVAKKRGFYSEDLMRRIANAGSIQGFKEVPKDVRDIFVTSQDIKPEWHIKMQSTLQRYVDNSISKTINFPRSASIRDVEQAYVLAWKSKCKGITIYRDGSYEEQVINIGE